MTVTVIPAQDDSGVDCFDAVYATARGGTGTLGASATNPFLGQSTGFYVEEYFARFDTSVIPDTDVISAALLEVYIYQDISTVDFTIQARLRDYGATVETSDFVPGASLAGLTLLATRASAGLIAGDFNPFADVALIANINVTGFTPIVLCADTTAAGTTPTSEEDVRISSSGGAGAMRLTITHAPSGGGGGDVVQSMIGGAFIP